jgi:cobalamin biosynthetic protein CobC
MTGAGALEHGGDLAAASRAYGDPPGGWLDLSTGVNPHAYPVDGIDPRTWARLPDADLLDACLAAARARYRIPDTAGLVAAPGTQAILQWLPYVARSRRVAVVAPTYGEHARTWRLAAADGGGEVTETASLAAAVSDGAVDTAVLCNPNNPDGRVESPDAVMGAAARLAARGGRLIVDEAFCDTRPDLSVAPGAGGPGLIVLRSLGKIYGLAGLRVGFAATEPSVAAALAARLGPWAVSGPALSVARRALDDGDWLAAQGARLAIDCDRLDSVLTAKGFKIIGGTDLFRLIETPAAGSLFDHLARSGIWVRRFSGYPTWLRFGLPGRDDEWRKVEAALGAFGG